MKIENKKMLLYSMNRAIEETREAIRDTEKSEKEMYYRIGSALHWIVDCFDRVHEAKIQISPDDERYRMALHAANNALKHRPELICLHRETGGGMRLPIRLSVRLSASFYVWGSLDNVTLKCKNQKQEYDKLLKNKKIDEIYEQVSKIIESYFTQDK